MKGYIVYRIQSIVNGKMYIGITKKSLDERVSEHVRNSRSPKAKPYNYHLCRAIRKYGIDSFECEVIESNISHKDIFEREVYWISYYKSYENGYNMTTGGEGTGGGVKNVGENHHRSVLDDDKVSEIKRLIVNGDTHISISNKYGVSRPTITDIAKGKNWSHIIVDGWEGYVLKRDNIIENKNKGSRHGMSKMNEITVTKIKEDLMKMSETITNIAKKYGVSRVMVSRIANNKSWKHVNVQGWKDYTISKGCVCNA